jgi:hypothetical protein
MKLQHQVEDCNTQYLQGVQTRREIAAAVERISQRTDYSDCVKYYAYTYLMGLRSHNHNTAVKARADLLAARKLYLDFARRAEAELAQIKYAYLRSDIDKQSFTRWLSLFAEFYAGTPSAEVAKDAMTVVQQSWLSSALQVGQSALSYALRHPWQTGLFIFSAGIAGVVARQPKVLDNVTTHHALLNPIQGSVAEPVIATVIEEQFSQSDEFESVLEEPPVPSDELKSVFSHFRAQRFKAALRDILTEGQGTGVLAHALKNPGVSAEAVEKSNQGDALASVEIVSQFIGEKEGAATFNELDIMKFFMARALVQSPQINPQVQTSLKFVLLKQMSWLISQHLQDPTALYDPEGLASYEQHYDALQRLNMQHDSLAYALDLSEALSSKDEAFQRQINAVLSPEALRQRGIAVPAVYDPTKAKLSHHLDTMVSDPNLDAILRMSNQHVVVINGFDSAVSDPRLLQNTRAKLGELKITEDIFVRAEQGEIAPMIRVAQSLIRYASRNDLAKEWLLAATRRGSALAFGMYTRMTDMDELVTTLANSRSELSVLTRHFAASGYAHASYLLGLRDTDGYNYFQKQGEFQDFGRVSKENRHVSMSPESREDRARVIFTFVSWLMRITLFTLFVLTTRRFPPALFFMATELIGIYTGYIWTLRSMFLMTPVIIGRIKNKAKFNAVLDQVLNRRNVVERAPRRQRVPQEPNPDQIALEARQEEAIIVTLAYLNELLDSLDTDSLPWTYAREKQQFELRLASHYVRVCLEEKTIDFTQEKIIRFIHSVLDPYIPKFRNSELNIPLEANQEAWPEINGVKSQFVLQLKTEHTQTMAAALQKVQQDCAQALSDCTDVLTEAAVRERERLWRRIRAYHDTLVLLVGHDDLRETLNSFLVRARAIDGLLKQVSERQLQLRQLCPVNFETLEKAQVYSGYLLEQCEKIRTQTERLHQDFNKIPDEDELTAEKKDSPPKAHAVAAVTPKPKPSKHSKGSKAFFKNTPATTEKPTAAAAVKELVAGLPSLTQKPTQSTGLVAAEKILGVSTRPGFEGFFELRGKGSEAVAAASTKPPVKVKLFKLAVPSVLTGASVAVKDHCAHIWSLLSKDNPYHDEKSLLYRGLYYHTLRMLFALSEDATDAPRQQVCKELYEALSHGYFIALSMPELLVAFCRGLTKPMCYKIFDVEAIKATGFYQGFLSRTGFNSKHYEVEPGIRLQHLQIEVELLQACRKVFKAEKQPKFATHYHSAAKGCLTLLGECAARFFETSAAHRVALAWNALESYRANLQGNIKLDKLQARCSYLLNNMVLLRTLVPVENYMALTVNCTAVINACKANNKELALNSLSKLLQALKTLEEADARLADVLQTVSVLDACRYLIRNNIKHTLDAESLDIYAENQLTIAVEEVSVEQVIQRTVITSGGVRLAAYQDFMKANSVAEDLPHKTTQSSLRISK